MNVAFVSRRPFPDGAVEQPIPENDPANIAYVLGGDYFSFLSLGKLRDNAMARRLGGYDLVFVALDLRNLDVVERVAKACGARLATYSEGGIGDYEMHPPAGQTAFLRLIRGAAINLLYWEAYVPFYRTLTAAPVEYLPYPYLLDRVEVLRTAPAERPRHVTLPSGFGGKTRNGLASLAVAKRLLEAGDIARINCWLSKPNFADDAAAVRYFVEGTPLPVRRLPRLIRWREWLRRSRIDYRPLLELRNRLFRKGPDAAPQAAASSERLALYARRPWPDYMAVLARSKLLVDMNNRETVGRNALDCAALRIPCVSTGRSDMQRRLFPDTTLDDSWDVDGAVALCRRLLDDQAFYQPVVEGAAVAVTEFGPDAFRRRWQAILERHPQLCSLRGQ